MDWLDLILLQSPNRHSFHIVQDVSGPLIILTVTVELNSLLRRHFFDQCVDPIVLEPPITLNEEIKNS